MNTRVIKRSAYWLAPALEQLVRLVHAHGEVTGVRLHADLPDVRLGSLYTQLDRLRQCGWLVAVKRDARWGRNLLHWSLSEQGLNRIAGEALPTWPERALPTTPPPHLPCPKRQPGCAPRQQPAPARLQRSAAERAMAPQRGAPIPLSSQFAREADPLMPVQMLYPQRPLGLPLTSRRNDWHTTYCPPPPSAPARAGAADFLSKPSRGPF